MTTKELRSIIQEIVAKEIKEQFPALISEILGSKNAKLPLQRREFAPIAEQKRSTVTIKTGNPALDKILSETTGLPREASSPNVSSEFGLIGEGTVIPQTDINGNEVNIDALPESISNIFKKDYSALLKKADSIAKKTHRGNSPL
jgi:hypothetical protein